MLSVRVARVWLMVASASTLYGCQGPASEPTPAPASTGEPRGEAVHSRSGERLALRGPATTVELEKGKVAHHYGTIFMLGAIRQSTDPVTLHVRGITAAPGTHADVYLEVHRGHYVPDALIGSIDLPEGAVALDELVLEVKDFEDGGRSHRARSELREVAHFGLELVVTAGQLSVEEFELRTEPE